MGWEDGQWQRWNREGMNDRVLLQGNKKAGALVNNNENTSRKTSGPRGNGRDKRANPRGSLRKKGRCSATWQATEQNENKPGTSEQQPRTRPHGTARDPGEELTLADRC